VRASCPPAPLWWVSALNTLLVLDGHDRISAALAESTVPDVVVLTPAPNPSWGSNAQRHLVRGYEGRLLPLQTAADHGDGLSKTRIADITRPLAGQLNDIARSEGRTRAWLLPGGRAAWEQQAAELVPDWTVGPA
jgi:hypothetical protein